MNSRNLLVSALALLFLGLQGCQKVIQVDLNTSDPKFVIEGSVTLGDSTHQVTISRSLNIYEGIENPKVNNAIVTLSAQNGASQVMTLVSPGVYEASNFPVEENGVYTLKVEVEGKTFVSTSQMPKDVVLSNLTSLKFSFGAQENYILVPAYQDPANIANFYQFNVFKNGEQVEGIFIQDDKLKDGKYNQQPIFAGDIKVGDSVRVELYGVTKEVYDYYFVLEQNLQGATPANPTSNFSGGCIGFFSTRTKSAKQTVVI